MKKIMFNDRFELTRAVLDGRKTQTRRFPSPRLIDKYNDLMEEFQVASINIGAPCSVVSMEDFLFEHAPYKVNETVAVAQSYKNAGVHFEDIAKGADMLSIRSRVKGFANKMFIKSELMPHQIRITNVRVQQLQDITDEECLLEGVFVYHPDAGQNTIASINDTKEKEGCRLFDTVRESYAYMIDAMSGKGTWDSNPYVFAYDFELLT